jgi:putative phosphoribosyl transferase
MGMLLQNAGYYTSRYDAGRRFAKDLVSLRYENTAVLALSPGGVVIGNEIAKELHSIIGLLLMKHVMLPGGETALGLINASGGFTYDHSFSAGQIEEFEMDYRTNIELSKMEAIHKLHTIGQGGDISPQYFNGRSVIIVNDFGKTGTSFQAAMDFLKPVITEKIIMIAPVATVKAADLMHSLADQVIIGHVTENDFPANHYYENNEIPETQELLQLLDQIILQW